MAVNYLLLVHKNPNQFFKLFEALDAPWCNFFIHVDKKCDVIEFKNVVPEKNNVLYVSDENRIDGKWGDLSLVNAALSCMRLAIECNADGHFVLLSGQDYPLRKPEYIRDFFESHKYNNFMTVYPIPDPKKQSENGGMERFISYTFDCRNSKNPRMKAKIQPCSFRLKTILGFIRLARFRKDLLFKAMKLYFVKRDYPKCLSQHFNEFWCALNTKAVKKIVATFDDHPEIGAYYKYTHIPDETAFSSILLSDTECKSSLLPMCHYIDWSEGFAGSPKVLDESDLPKIKDAMTNKPYIMFARKFEETNHFIEIIDEHFLANV